MHLEICKFWKRGTCKRNNCNYFHPEKCEEFEDYWICSDEYECEDYHP